MSSAAPKVTSFRHYVEKYEANLSTNDREALDAQRRFYHLLHKHEFGEGITEEERHEALRLIYQLDR